MIEYNSKVWFRHVFDFHRIDTFRQLLPETLAVAAYTAAVVWAEWYFLHAGAEQDTPTLAALRSLPQIHALLGLVLSLLLVFRTNTAYERWWEGRKHWGALVNASRNLANKIDAFLPPSHDKDRRFFALMIGNFAVALKDHLRHGAQLDAMPPMDEAGSSHPGDWQHVPNRIAGEMTRRVKRLYAAGELSGDELIVIDRDLAALVDILGACERIRNTPIPYSYNIFLKKFIVFYIATLPFGFAALFAYIAVPLIAFVFYVLVSLEVIAEEIENPFGLDPNDLPTDQLAEAIRRNVEEVLGPAQRLINST